MGKGVVNVSFSEHFAYFTKWMIPIQIIDCYNQIGVLQVENIRFYEVGMCEIFHQNFNCQKRIQNPVEHLRCRVLRN